MLYSAVFCTVFLILPAVKGYSQSISQKNIINLNTSNAVNNSNQTFSLFFQAGKMTGVGNEYVMDNDRILSKLIWKIDELYMAGGGINWALSEGRDLKADLWLKIKDGKSVMDDYDWLVEGLDWTHWSHHDDTIISKAGTFDFSYTYTPLRFRHSNFKIKALIGYKFTDFEWETRGGYYIYSQTEFRDTEGTFSDDQLVITYEQIFHTPYGGIEVYIPAGIFFLESRLTGSFAVFGRAIDHHHLRNLVTTADFFWGNMLSADISGGIKLNSILLSGEYSYIKYDGLRGDSAYDQNGVVTVYENLEKADFESSMFSIAVSYTF